MKKILIIAITLMACKDNEPMFQIPENNFPNSEYDISQLNTNQVKLGKKIFNDPLLSRDGTVSCASCHIPSMAFTHHGHDVSHGIDDQLGKRNTLPLFNLAWYKTFFWDGGVFQLDLTPVAAITNEVEMDESVPNVIQKLRKNKEYVSEFKKTYGSSPITDQQFLKALGQYLASLQSMNSKYDEVQAGRNSFTVEEAKGYTLFKTHCATCHQEPTFRSEGFFNIGLPIGYINDLGRYEITGQEEDKYKFRAPSLRNLAYTQPYMHDGRFRTLERVLRHYRTGMIDYPNLDHQFKDKTRLDVTEEEANYIISFLNTLNDPKFIENIQK